ncbi:MAG TPA: sucrase ferredoxin [Phenylobacterium sp.]|uniref:sucrase ferredoxin n=1 Tax=Phenylobacterium sp. TaxID=1871053 RepID=UPI002B49E886|nr:sucrase ferredoxin [Phenylobacterium sp.]HKR87342.1 sucrase ferredoxin [Phenylobacterium sp.]
MNFCSRVSIARHEHLAGTGVRAQAYVFVPVPKRFWHEREMNSHWASREELQAVQAARKAGVVTRLYNPQPGDATEELPVIVHAQDDLPAPGLSSLVALFARRWRVDRTGRPTLAICTHGTRDRCCAKFGFAAYQSARKLVEEGISPFEAIESSHLGGDRFAATGIFFPSGSMYAHLGDLDLAALCTAETGGRIDPARYRGRVYDPQVVQLVRAGLARQGLLNDAIAPVAITPKGPCDLEASVRGQRFHVRLKAAEVEFYGSCAALSAAKPSHGTRTVFDHAERLGAPGR